ncbi:MAG: hypothetical protein HKN16_13055 [Saprospiraceae bacterium]|nr:hypothetical protein [Saprospiraceae bacterium]
MRYSRQTILKEFGQEGQEKLAASKVLVIGAGGLGGPVLSYLAGAGVGGLGVIDGDEVEISNLHRQVHFRMEDIGKNKARVSKNFLLALNPDIEVKAYPEHLMSANALEIFQEYDIAVDCSDNFPTRYLVNDACVLSNKPMVYGAINQFEGQVSVFNFDGGPNYRDLFPEPPKPGMVPSCAEAGVLGVLPGIIGSMQANEVIKMITGIGEVLSRLLLLFDARTNQIQKIKFHPRSDNPLTGTNPSQRELIDYEAFCGIRRDREVTPQQVENGDFFLVDVREDYEFDEKNIGGKNIPLADLVFRLDELPSDKKILLVCQKGERAKTAIQLFESRDLNYDLYSLKGGVDAWGD